MIALRATILFLLVALVGSAADAQTLKIADRQSTATVTAEQLLAHPAVRDVAIARDPVFGRAMTYRAVPVPELLKGLSLGTNDYVEFTATDKFSIGIPVR